MSSTHDFVVSDASVSLSRIDYSLTARADFPAVQRVLTPLTVADVLGENPVGNLLQNRAAFERVLITLRLDRHGRSFSKPASALWDWTHGTLPTDARSAQSLVDAVGLKNQYSKYFCYSRVDSVLYSLPVPLSRGYATGLTRKKIQIAFIQQHKGAESATHLAQQVQCRDCQIGAALRSMQPVRRWHRERHNVQRDSPHCSSRRLGGFAVLAS